MAILLLFTAVALALFSLGVLALAWAVRAGQLDDLDTPALRILTEDSSPQGPPPADAHAPARPRI